MKGILNMSKKQSYKRSNETTDVFQTSKRKDVKINIYIDILVISGQPMIQPLSKLFDDATKVRNAMVSWSKKQERATNGKVVVLFTYYLGHKNSTKVPNLEPMFH